jgi:hypothetical protein
VIVSHAPSGTVPISPMPRGARPFSRTTVLTAVSSSASAARLWRGAPSGAPAQHPIYRRSHAHLETFGRFASGRPRLYCFDNAFPQVTRIGLRHR